MSTSIQQYDEVSFARDCEAIQIPSGNKLTVPKGSTGTVTQTLGGSFTLQVPAVAALVRILEKDLDAIYKEGKPVVVSAAATCTAPIAAVGELGDEAVFEVLKRVYDPEIPVNVVDLGLIYDVQVTKLAQGGNRVEVKMTLTAPGCGMGPSIAGDAQMKLLATSGISEANVQLVWDPPWNPSMISPEGKKKLGIE